MSFAIEFSTQHLHNINVLNLCVIEFFFPCLHPMFCIFFLHKLDVDHHINIYTVKYLYVCVHNLLKFNSVTTKDCHNTFTYVHKCFSTMIYIYFDLIIHVF